MSSLIKILAMLLICLAGIGFYRGWFSLSRCPSEPQSSTVNVDVSVDKAKMKSDIKKAEEKVKSEIKELESKSKTKKTAN